MLTIPPPRTNDALKSSLGAKHPQFDHTCPLFLWLPQHPMHSIVQWSLRLEYYREHAEHNALHATKSRWKVISPSSSIRFLIFIVKSDWHLKLLGGAFYMFLLILATWVQKTSCVGMSGLVRRPSSTFCMKNRTLTVLPANSFIIIAIIRATFSVRHYPCLHDS